VAQEAKASQPTSPQRSENQSVTSTPETIVELVEKIERISNDLYNSVLDDWKEMAYEDARLLVREVEKLKILANVPTPVYPFD
jgi:hypothetical protein